MRIKLTRIQIVEVPDGLDARALQAIFDIDTRAANNSSAETWTTDLTESAVRLPVIEYVPLEVVSVTVEELQDIDAESVVRL